MVCPEVPYCDFNSHALKTDIPELDYIDALIEDLDTDLAKYGLASQSRELHSIFIGGGTPSLISAPEIGRLLEAVKQRLPFSDNIEITMEANPGTVEAGRFNAYREVGVNRISIGIQSFQDEKLKRLGRIHGSREAITAAGLAQEAGLDSFNIDLMHGLPDQSIDDALSDLKQAIALEPPHLSWYQLTIEPNTCSTPSRQCCRMTTTYGKSSSRAINCWLKQATSSTRFPATANRAASAAIT